MSIKIPFNSELPVSIVVFEGEATFIAQAEHYQSNWSHWERAKYMQCQIDQLNPSGRGPQDVVFLDPACPTDQITVEKVGIEVIALIMSGQAIWLWIDPRGTPLMSLAIHPGS